MKELSQYTGSHHRDSANRREIRQKRVEQRTRRFNRRVYGLRYEGIPSHLDRGRPRSDLW